MAETIVDGGHTGTVLRMADFGEQQRRCELGERVAEAEEEARACEGKQLLMKGGYCIPSNMGWPEAAVCRALATIIKTQPILMDIFRPKRSETMGAMGREAMEPIAYMAWRRPMFAPTG